MLCSRVNNPAQKAITYSVLLLKYRLRSESELRERLRKKKFPAELIDAAIAFLRDKKYIDDGVFARQWFASRMQQSCGIRRIKQELKAKGVDAQVIEQAHHDAGEYSEAEAARGLVKKRLRVLAGTRPDTIKQRLYGYLMRRGFGADIIEEVLEEIVK